MPEPEIDTYDCDVTLPGWRLHLAQMEFSRWRDLGNVMDLATEGGFAQVRRNHPDGRPESGATVAMIRERIAGMGLGDDAPRLCSEQLIAELLDKETFPRGCLPWEFLALLTIKSQAPWAVLDRRSFTPPLVFRLGEPGEVIRAAAADVDVAGLPVLADVDKALASPFVLPSRYDLEGCDEPLFVCFLPADLFRKVQPKNHVGRAVWLTWAYRFVFEKTCTHRPAESA